MKLRIWYDDQFSINAFYWTPKHSKESFHFHDSLEIGCCVSGSGHFYFSDKTYVVQPGDIYVVNNKELHIAQSDPQNPSVYLFINFDPALLLQEDEELLMPFAYSLAEFDNHIPGDTDEARSIGQTMALIKTEIDGKAKGYRSYAKSLLIETAVLLLRRYAQTAGAWRLENLSREFRRRRTILHFMEKHYLEPIQLTDLADYLGLSESSASKTFNEVVGSSFKEYLNYLRVQEAKRRLATTSQSVIDIGFDSGFQSVQSFYRWFHKHTSLSPQAFRQKVFVSSVFEKDSGETGKPVLSL